MVIGHDAPVAHTKWAGLQKTGVLCYHVNKTQVVENTVIQKRMKTRLILTKHLK